MGTGIYHSSKYAAKTDEQWKEIKIKILKEHGEHVEKKESEEFA